MNRKILILLLLPNVVQAQQGNYHFDTYGNRSIILLGNVTGTVDDLGLTYYNPARLSTVENPIFTLNAKAYQYSKYTLKDIAGQDTKNSKSSFGSIPTMMAGTFKAFGERFAFSLITTSDLDLDVSYKLPQTSKDAFPDIIGEEQLSSNLNYRAKTKDEWYGLTWSRKITSHVSFGISGFYSRYENSGSASSNTTVNYAGSKVGYSEESFNYNMKTHGLFWKVGASYVKNIWELGINVSLPFIQLHKSGSFNYHAIAAGMPNQHLDDFMWDENYNKIPVRRKTPLGINLGAGLTLGKHKIHTNIQYFSKISKYKMMDVASFSNGQSAINPDFEDERKAVINYGAGAEIFINKSITIYAAFSSDYSSLIKNEQQVKAENLSISNINIPSDFLHYSIGTNINMDWAQLTIGATFSHSNAKFSKPIYLPIDFAESPYTNIRFEKWRFLVGIEVPLFKEKMKSLFNK